MEGNAVARTTTLPRLVVNTSAFEFTFIILGGLPFYLPFVLMLGEKGLWSNNPIEWSIWVNAAVSSPHVYSTYVRLQRKVTEKKVHWVFGWPLYAAIATILGILTWRGYYVETLTAVNLWQSYHYLRQVYGVGRIYDRNKEPQIQKLLFWAFHLAIPLFVLGRWNMLYLAWHGKPTEYIIPVAMPGLVMGACAVLAGAGLLCGLAAEWKKLRQPTYNPIGLLVLIIYYAIHWFGFLSVEFYMRGFFTVTIFHAIQYLSLVWWFERAQKPSAQSESCEVAEEHAEEVKLTLPKKAEQKFAHFLDFLRFGPLYFAFAGFWLVLFAGSYIWEHNVLQCLNTFWARMGAVLLGSISAHHYAIDTVLWRAKAGK